MHRKKLFIGILTLILASTVFLLVWLNRAPEVTAEQVDIGDLISMFQDNEKLANDTYTEKLIEVHGVVEEISFLNNRHTILLRGDKFAQNFILCDMAYKSKEGKERITKGDTIKLKGVCKGYLLDVIMLNCVPIDEKN